MIALLFIIILITITHSSSQGLEQKQGIPPWIKTTTKWWSDSEIEDGDFTKQMKYLIQHRIIKISETKTDSSLSQEMPSWMKTYAGLWAENKISDTKFIQTLEYLIQIGIIDTQTPCDKSLWNHVLSPFRLHIIADCIIATGTIESISKRGDGDYHIELKLDPEYTDLVNSGNIRKLDGNLLLEPICQNPTIEYYEWGSTAACANFTARLDIPPVGSHVQVAGSYVFDAETRWMEIHPVTSFKLLTP